MYGWWRLSEGVVSPMSRKEAIGFLSDLVLAFVFGVMPLPVAVRWTGWLFCWLGFLYFVLSVFLGRLPLKTRVLTFIVLTLAFVVGFAGPAISQWKAEQAALTAGNLLGGPKEAFRDRRMRYTPWVAIGDSKSVLQMVPNDRNEPYFKPFPDAQFLVRVGRNGPMISTTIRDYRGDLVATVTDNHWKIYPPFCLDKNYTDSAFEVQDDSGHVVFQAVLLPHGGGSGPKGLPGVEVQGEWWDNQGRGVRFLKNPEGDSGEVIPLTPQDQRDYELIRPIFKYPSSEHWGEFSGN